MMRSDSLGPSERTIDGCIVLSEPLRAPRGTYDLSIPLATELKLRWDGTMQWVTLLCGIFGYSLS